jgi:hypothetical protein
MKNSVQSFVAGRQEPNRDNRFWIEAAAAMKQKTVSRKDE